MTVTKTKELDTKDSSVTIQVSNDLTVQITKDKQYEFLMTTKQVALGYGTSEYNIRQHKLEQSSELIEGKHYLSNVSIPHGAQRGATRGTMWTKRGIIRLGFFIKSKNAKVFRDWAEELVIEEIHNSTVTELNSLPKPRKHNRLTSERMIDILHDVCMIEDNELRSRIAAKLKGGN